MCCTQAETCCPDKVKGPVCCLEETTFCCPADGINPSRCCPRYMVCCKTGRFGCCDPGADENGEYPDVVEPPFAGPTTAYSVYDSFPNGNLAGLSIDMASGKRTSKEVPGYNTWGEMTRVFAYNPDKNVFYLPQANFLTNTTVTNITLYTVDPVAGTSTAQQIQGAFEDGIQDVSGFDYNHHTGLIILSTAVTNGIDDTVLGYNFYNVDPATAQATLVSSYRDPNPAEWVGWFDATSADGTLVYRLGYQDVTDQTIWGLGVTNISAATTTTVWHPDVPLVAGHDYYQSFNIYGDDFLSLAPATNTGLYSVVKWNFNNATVIAKFSDAYDVPIFGSVAEYINRDQTTYAALVSRNESPATLDRWELLVVDLTTGASRAVELSPLMLSKATSIAGLGFA